MDRPTAGRLHVATIGATLLVVIAGVGCSPDDIDIDPSTIGGAEPSEMVGGDVSERDDPVVRREGEHDDAEVARPDALDRLRVEDTNAPWYLREGNDRASVRAALDERLGDERAVVCAYLDQALDEPARARLSVPSADRAYPDDDAPARRRLVASAVDDALADEVDTRDARLARAMVDTCDLDVEVARLRDAARASLRRIFDLPGADHVDPNDEGWAEAWREAAGPTHTNPPTAGSAGRSDTSESAPSPGAAQDAAPAPDPTLDDLQVGAVASTTGSDADRAPAVVARWAARVDALEAVQCDWFTAPPAPADHDDLVERLVVLRGDAHDGLPAAAQAVAERCLAGADLGWRGP